MTENIKRVITDILTAFYQPFWFALLLAVVFMFAYKYNTNLKQALKQWFSWFKNEKQFRRVFYFAFYTVMVLFRTLFDRTLFENPLSNVFGEWSFYEEVNAQPVFNANVPENILLLLPFIVLLFVSFKEKLFKDKVTILKVLGHSFVISFLSSLTIETLQLLLHLGTWQLSDLCYNTIGGVAGGMIYFICYKIKHRRRISK